MTASSAHQGSLWLLIIWYWIRDFCLGIVTWVIQHLRELGSYGYIFVAAGQSFVIAAWIFQDHAEILTGPIGLTEILIWAGVVLACVVVGFFPIVGLVAAIYGFVKVFGGLTLALQLFVGPYAFFVAMATLIWLIRELVTLLKRDCLDSSPCRGTDNRVPRWRRYILLRLAIIFCFFLAAFFLVVVLQAITATWPRIKDWWQDAVWPVIQNWAVIDTLMAIDDWIIGELSGLLGLLRIDMPPRMLLGLLIGLAIIIATLAILVMLVTLTRSAGSHRARIRIR